MTDDPRIASQLKRQTAPRIWHRRLSRGLRFALTLAIVGSACYVSYGFGRLWHDWRQIGNANASARPTACRDAMLELLPLAGQWSFGDLDWNLRSQNVEPKEIAIRLETLAADAGSTVAEHLPDLGDELINLAQYLHIKPVQHGGNRIYRLDRPDLKAQLVVRLVNGRVTAVSLAAALPKSSGQWQLLEFTPRAATGHSKGDAAHLLPLPGPARRNASRFADDGRLLLEFVTVDSDADTLLTMWKQSDWQIRPTEFAGPNDFSYLCARGEDVIYVWSASPRGALHDLMLVRTPASADTQ